MKNKKLGKSLKKFYNKKENVQDILYGELGVPINGVQKVDVPGRPGYVYVRLRGNASELVQAYNATVPTKYDYPVIVSRKKNTYIILGRDQAKFGNMGNVGSQINFQPLVNHGGQHSFNPALGMGADPVWVYGQQFMPQLAYPSGTSMFLAVNPYFYEWEGQWKYPQITGTPSFAPYVPTVTGSARMALLYMNGANGQLEIVGGPLFSGGISRNQDLAQYIPDIDRNSYIPLAAVKLTTGTAELEWTDVYDMRDFFTVTKYFKGIGIQDDGTPVGTGTTLNFVGNGVIASISGTVVQVLVTGSVETYLPHAIHDPLGYVQIGVDGIANNSTVILYTTPANKSGYITSIYLHHYNASASVNAVRLEIFDASSVTQWSYRLAAPPNGVEHESLSFTPPFKIASSWGVRLVSPAAGAAARSTITGYEV